MNTFTHARQQAQLSFIASAENIVVGDSRHCPMSPEKLMQLSSSDPCVVECFDGGLTAQVLHLCIDGRHYTLKQKRHEALVRNTDGQTSFLNEVQRRADFTRLKNDPLWAGRFDHIVPTIYANFRQGIILSPWLPGHSPVKVDEDLFEQVLSTLMACEEAGLMEWDLCPGNLLMDNGHLWLFDFGYMYPFQPLHSYNSNGLQDPLFHACERFETRFFFGRLLEENQPEAVQLSQYRALKKVALKHYRHKREKLVSQGADAAVLVWLDAIIASWQQALRDNQSLQRGFTIEAFRSHVLDVEDDLHGQSCTPLTLKRIEYITQSILACYEVLNEGGALFYDNKDKSQRALLAQYQRKRQLACDAMQPQYKR